MSIQDEIRRARRCLEHPPAGESNTCEWVILPLLWAAGYERHEIWSRIRDDAGQFPDYTILPDSDHTWFLEAKAWGVELQEAHAIQATNYAHSKGRWWVVLTNGRVWRLYDDRIPGRPDQRLITEAHLESSDLAEFVAAIGKDAVVSGTLEGFALERRMASVLDAQLSDPNSRVVKAIRSVLRADFGLTGVTGGGLVRYFGQPSLAEAPDPAQPASEGVAVPETTGTTPGVANLGGDLEECDDDSIDTIVVPAQEEGFRHTFLGENRWYAIRVNERMRTRIRHIAAYRVAPTSAITHIAPVKSVEPWQDGDKCVVVFSEPAYEIGPIPWLQHGKTKAPQGPRYASKLRLEGARSLDEVWPRMQ